MDVYLDASVIVALLTNDALTGRARAFLQTGSLTLFVSDYAGAEVASVIARRVRTRELTEAEAMPNAHSQLPDSAEAAVASAPPAYPSVCVEVLRRQFPGHVRHPA